MTPPPINPLAAYSQHDAAELLGISPAQARATLPGCQISPRVWRILGQTLLDHLSFPAAPATPRPLPPPARTAASSKGSNGQATLEAARRLLLSGRAG